MTDFINSDVFYQSEPTEEPTEAGENPEVKETAEADEPTAELETTETDNTPRYQLDEESGEYIFKANGQETRANVDKLVELASKGLGYEKNNARLNRREEERSKAHQDALAAVQSKASELESIATGLEALLLDEQKALDSEIDDLDFTEYQKRKNSIEDRKRQVEQAKAKAQQANQSQLSATLNEQWGLLRDALEWDTDEKAEAGMKEINDYAKYIGATVDDMKGVYSHKVYQAFSDAAKYRALLKKTQETVKEVKSAPKSVKSKVSTPAKERTAAEILYGS